MSNVESAACWARDTPLGRLSLLVLHDGRYAWAEGELRAAARKTERSREAKGGIKGEETKMEIEGVMGSRLRGKWAVRW